MKPQHSLPAQKMASTAFPFCMPPRTFTPRPVFWLSRSAIKPLFLNGLQDIDAGRHIGFGALLKVYLYNNTDYLLTFF